VFVSLGAQTDSRYTGMELEMTLAPLCYKCDQRSMTLGDGGRPLCSRHAMLFVTAPRILADRSESPDGAGREPAHAASDSDAGAVDAVMESIERSLEGIEDAVQEIEAVTGSSGPDRETEIDLVFTLNNMFHDVDEVWLEHPDRVVQPPTLGNQLIEALLESVAPQPPTEHALAIWPVSMPESPAA